jgi:hypothetical protein
MTEKVLQRVPAAGNGNGLGGSAVKTRTASTREQHQARSFLTKTRATPVKLFLTCALVFGLHFATNTVREIYPALSLGDRLSFDVSEYYGLHPDIFEMPGRGVFINNNPGASVMGAVPYFLARPVVDAIVQRVNTQRSANPTADAQSPGYDSIYPMAREFYERSRERGYDVKFGLGAAIMQAFVMVPISALSVIVIYFLLLQVTGRPRAATLLALLYAFATPVFYRTAQLNQNLLLAHFALFAFVLLWRPGSKAATDKRPFYFLAGLCAGWTVVLDYSGLVALLALSGYAVARWLGTDKNERSIAELGKFALGVSLCGAFLMAYQWSSFGNPILPAQSYMPPANFSDAGYRGFSLPSLDLLFDTAFSLRFGLFTSAPILLLAFYVPAWIRDQSAIFERREIIFIVTFVSLFFVFCSANQFGRMQFNTGVRHIVPAAPFVFLLAANVILRMPVIVASILGALGTYWMWCLVMYRDVEQGLGIPDAIKNITLGGFQFPWLSTLERMGYVQHASPLPLILVSAALIWILWNVKSNRETAGA